MLQEAVMLGTIAQQSPYQVELADEVQRLDGSGGGLGTKPPV
jgi:hypothetical protein